MARARKPHPADLANANVVASAARFEIALFLGVGRYATDTAETLDEARRKAARLMATHRNGRRPLIYGVTSDGRSGLVTGTPLMEVPMKTYAKKFNVQRAAKAAGHKADEIEIVKAKDGFKWRVKQGSVRPMPAMQSSPPIPRESRRQTARNAPPRRSTPTSAQQ